MEAPQKNKKWKIILMSLLLLLVVSTTALGITLVVQHQASHPTVSVPLVTEPEKTEPSAGIPEETEQATAETVEATAETVEATAEAVAATAETVEATAETVEATEQATVETATETTAEATEPTTAPKPTTPKPTAPKPTTPKPTEPQVEATLLTLHNRQEGDNVPFFVLNLFPGDSTTRYYCVRVSHSDSVTLHYRADVRSGSEKLAEVLKVRVSLPAKGVTLYDGLMGGMPKALDHGMSGYNRADDLVYEITAYLDPSVGNDYQNQQLIADFRWWIEEADQLAPPKTGDSSMIILWATLSVASLAALLVLICLMHRKKPALARLLLVLVALALLLSILSVTAFAVSYLEVSVKMNVFQTGTVEINLNDGNPVTEGEMFTRFEPGMTAAAGFFVENKSTDAVYYKLYFEDVEGTLADVLKVTVTTADGSKVLYDTDLSSFTRTGAGAAKMELGLNEKKELMIWFHFPEEAGNACQEQSLRFVLCADAVQAKNNPNGGNP